VVASALSRGRDALAVRTIAADDGQLDVVLRSGLLVRLGEASDIALKLAVARRIVPLAPGARYIDVTVPDRAVASLNPQAGSRG
jgi:hypothetical protein